MTGLTEVSIWNEPTDQGRTMKVECKSTVKRHQISKPFPKHLKRIRLDTDGLVKGEGTQRQEKTQALHGIIQIQLCLSCNHLNLVEVKLSLQLWSRGSILPKDQIRTILTS